MELIRFSWRYPCYLNRGRKVLFIDETCVVYQQFGFSFHVRWTELSRFEVQVAVLDFNLEQTS